MKLSPVVNFINLSWRNLQSYWLYTLSFDLGDAAKDVNYTHKMFMKLLPVANFINL
jgi:hypothetical protein